MVLNVSDCSEYWIPSEPFQKHRKCTPPSKMRVDNLTTDKGSDKAGRPLARGKRKTGLRALRIVRLSLHV